jgi:hypothetical protein
MADKNLPLWWYEDCRASNIGISRGSEKWRKGANMPPSVLIELEIPADLEQFRLPAGVQRRLQELLDRQDRGTVLSPAERQGAEGLVDLAELLSLLRLRGQRAAQQKSP